MIYRHTNLLNKLVELAKSLGFATISHVHPTPAGAVVVIKDKILSHEYVLEIKIINSTKIVQEEKPLMFADVMKTWGIK